MTNTTNATHSTPHKSGGTHDHDHGHDHKHDHGHDHKHDHGSDHKHEHEKSADKSADSCCSGADHVHAPAFAAPPMPPGMGLALRIPAMDCAAEESDIRRALEPLTQIRSLRFHLGARTLWVDAPEALYPAVMQAVRDAGFAADPITQDSPTAEDSGRSELWRLSFALVLAIAAEGLAFALPDSPIAKYAGMAIAAAAIAFAGLGTYKKGLLALRRGQLNIAALMTVAVTGAFFLGEWPEAAMVMALYAIAELIEARSIDKARATIQKLLTLAPEEAEVLQPDGKWSVTLARDIPIGAEVRVKPGERIALDGVVTLGQSAIDQSAVTGESLPVDKTVGDILIAGTINTSGGLQYRVTALAANSTLARIIQAVEQAQGTRAPTQRIVDRFAAVYTPLMFAMAVLVAVIPPLFFGWTWTDSIYKALVLLVIACPCALVIATPVTVVSGLTAAARRGILIKGGVYLEQARQIKAVALDKTGTLTEGRPKLVAFKLMKDVPEGSPEHTEIGVLAASIATRSDHPVSQAIAAGLSFSPAAVEDFQALPGRGVQGLVQGRELVLGNQRLLEERKQLTPALQAQLEQLLGNGHSVSILADASGPLAVMAVADSLKPDSAKAVAELQAMGITPVMLTGDHPAAAQFVAKQAGVTDARGGLLPEDKLVAVKEMQQRYGITAMVGDGINDAPALAQAEVGFAMGVAGTDIAMDTADVVIMNDDLRQIATTVALSRKVYSVLWQNIIFALGVKAIFFVLAVFGGASMWMAVFADMGASLLVVANGLRLLRDNAVHPKD